VSVCVFERERERECVCVSPSIPEFYEQKKMCVCVRVSLRACVCTPSEKGFVSR